MSDPFDRLDLNPVTREIGRLVVDGKTLKEIAVVVGLHRQTVHAHTKKAALAAGVERPRDLIGWYRVKEKEVGKRYIARAVIDERTCFSCLARADLEFDRIPEAVCTSEGGCRCTFEEMED